MSRCIASYPEEIVSTSSLLAISAKVASLIEHATYVAIDWQSCRSEQAALLDISRAAAYYQARPISAHDLMRMRRIDELHLVHPFMGARMLMRKMRKEGIDFGRCHVRTLMQRLDIEALCPQPDASKARPGHKIYPYLLRNVAITCSNQVWALDTTYIPMAHGFVYLTAGVDVASRRVLAHKLATTLEAYHAVEIIEQAFARYGIPDLA